MEQLQQFFTNWVTSVADPIPLGYAFGAGMVSTVNPCGFAMLPAYPGSFLGSRDLVLAPPKRAMRLQAALPLLWQYRHRRPARYWSPRWSR